MQIALYGFSVPGEFDAAGKTYDSLRQVAGASWRTLEKVVLATRSGVRAIGAMRSEAAASASPISPKESERATANVFPPGAEGLCTEMVGYLQADGLTVEMDLAVSHRGRLANEGAILNAEAATNLRVEEGHPLLAHVWAIPKAGRSSDEQIQYVAVVVTAWLLDSKGQLLQAPPASVR